MRVLYCGPRRLEEARERELGMTFVPFNQLLAESDFVSLHQPSNAQTRHMIDERAFGLMKPTAFLINTARGPVVDEAALVRALNDKKIAGAGLDVYENEPQVSSALLNMRNVVLLSHIGSAVLELREKMANIVADNILAFLKGELPPNCINPDVLPGAKATITRPSTRHR